MKKLSKLIIICIVLAMTLTACSGKLPFPTVETTSPSSESAEKPSGSSIIPEKTTEAVTEKQEPQTSAAVPQTQATEPPETTTEALPLLDVLPIAEVEGSTITIPPYEEKEFRSTPAEIITYNGSFSKDGQEAIYELKAEEDGLYRFELNGLKSGFTVSIFVYDKNDYLIDQNYGTGNGDGISCELEKGKTYKVVLKQYTGSGSYTFSIGTQRKTEDLSAYTVVQETIDFKDQQINYKYVPAESGVYRFWISQIKSGHTVSIFVYDELGYLLDQSYGVSKDDGITVTLEKGKTYLLRLSQYTELGAFTLKVGIQKPQTAIDGYGLTTLYDSMQFKDQENLYSFQPDVSGRYHFEISKISSNNSVTFMVYDEDGYLTDCSYGLQSGGCLDVELEGQKNYLVKAIQYNGTDAYTMLIGCPKDTARIDGASYGGVTDSFQFNSQYNRYEFVPASSGTYQFEVAEAGKDMSITLLLRDKDGSVLNSSYGMREGYYFQTDLQQGVVCYFELAYYTGLGSYTVTIRNISQ